MTDEPKTNDDRETVYFNKKDKKSLLTIPFSEKLCKNLLYSVAQLEIFYAIYSKDNEKLKELFTDIIQSVCNANLFIKEWRRREQNDY